MSGQVSTVSGISVFYFSLGILLGVPAFAALHQVLGSYTPLFGLLALTIRSGALARCLAHKGIPSSSTLKLTADP